MTCLGTFPASRKLAYETLDRDGPLTVTELRKRTQMKARTVERSLADLKKADLVRTYTDPEDARRTLYELKYPSK